MLNCVVRSGQWDQASQEVVAGGKGLQAEEEGVDRVAVGLRAVIRRQEVSFVHCADLVLLTVTATRQCMCDTGRQAWSPHVFLLFPAGCAPRAAEQHQTCRDDSQ